MLMPIVTALHTMMMPQSRSNCELLTNLRKVLRLVSLEADVVLQLRHLAVGNSPLGCDEFDGATPPSPPLFQAASSTAQGDGTTDGDGSEADSTANLGGVPGCCIRDPCMGERDSKRNDNSSMLCCNCLWPSTSCECRLSKRWAARRCSSSTCRNSRCCCTEHSSNCSCSRKSGARLRSEGRVRVNSASDSKSSSCLSNCWAWTPPSGDRP
mmetsp:Transcript_23780/g.55477  ORF Transcript_23780/g.55477 Transcript_23780/m.55477 type:complete len:211 (-) Transcript_23780:228-860(-)